MRVIVADDVDDDCIRFWHAHTFIIPTISNTGTVVIPSNVLASQGPFIGPRFRTQFHNVSFGWRIGISEGTLGDETLDVAGLRGSSGGELGESSEEGFGERGFRASAAGFPQSNTRNGPTIPAVKASSSGLGPTSSGLGPTSSGLGPRSGRLGTSTGGYSTNRVSTAISGLGATNGSFGQSNSGSGEGPRSGGHGTATGHVPSPNNGFTAAKTGFGGGRNDFVAANERLNHPNASSGEKGSFESKNSTHSESNKGFVEGCGAINSSMRGFGQSNSESGGGVGSSETTTGNVAQSNTGFGQGGNITGGFGGASSEGFSATSEDVGAACGGIAQSNNPRSLGEGDDLSGTTNRGFGAPTVHFGATNRGFGAANAGVKPNSGSDGGFGSSEATSGGFAANNAFLGVTRGGFGASSEGFGAAAGDVAKSNTGSLRGAVDQSGTSNRAFSTSGGGFEATSRGFGATNRGFGATSTGFGATSTGFGATSTGFGATSTGFGATSTGFGAASGVVPNTGFSVREGDSSSGEATRGRFGTSVGAFGLGATRGHIAAKNTGFGLGQGFGDNSSGGGVEDRNRNGFGGSSGVSQNGFCGISGGFGNATSGGFSNNHKDGFDNDENGEFEENKDEDFVGLVETFDEVMVAKTFETTVGFGENNAGSFEDNKGFGGSDGNKEEGYKEDDVSIYYESVCTKDGEEDPVLGNGDTGFGTSGGGEFPVSNNESGAGGDSLKSINDGCGKSPGFGGENGCFGASNGGGFGATAEEFGTIIRGFGSTSGGFGGEGDYGVADESCSNASSGGNGGDGFGSNNNAFGESNNGFSGDGCGFGSTNAGFGASSGFGQDKHNEEFGESTADGGERTIFGNDAGTGTGTAFGTGAFGPAQVGGFGGDVIDGGALSTSAVSPRDIGQYSKANKNKPKVSKKPNAPSGRKSVAPPVPVKKKALIDNKTQPANKEQVYSAFKKRESSKVEQDRHKKAVIVTIECTDGIVCVGHGARVSVFVRHPITNKIMYARNNLPLTVDPRLTSCRCNLRTCICHITNHKRIALDADFAKLCKEGFVQDGGLEVVVILDIPTSSFSALEAFPPLPPPDHNHLVIHLWNDVVQNKETTDTRLMAKDGARLRCHRTVLAFKSPVFKQLFEQEPPKIEPKTAIAVQEEPKSSSEKKRLKPMLIIKRRAPPKTEDEVEENIHPQTERSQLLRLPPFSRKRKSKFLLCCTRKNKAIIVPEAPEDPRMTAWKEHELMAGPGGTLELNYSAEAIMEMLKFSYAQSHSTKFVNSDQNLITEVLGLANDYEMRGLVRRCERQLVLLVERSIDMAPALLSLAQSFHLNVLQNVSASTIITNYGLKSKRKDNLTWKTLKELDELETQELRQLLLQYSTETTRTNLVMKTAVAKQID